tara:strand:- start:334 stop:540 length:207 start_codon:yes stop_codon:yes gene_type:complete
MEEITQNSEEIIRDLKQELYVANDRINAMQKRHTRVVAKLHGHVDEYRKKMINCLNISVPNMDDDCSI